jgi:hypothetical protein
MRFEIAGGFEKALGLDIDGEPGDLV